MFFIYDHNLLKKEEDDLIDAILYFSPEHVCISLMSSPPSVLEINLFSW